MPPNPNAMSPPPTAHGHTPKGELHPRKADEASPTQCKLHTQPRSKHPCKLASTSIKAKPHLNQHCALPGQDPITGAQRLPKRRTGYRNQGPRFKAIQMIPRCPESQPQNQTTAKTQTSTPAQILTRRPKIIFQQSFR
ncbi:hypothetical protein XENOCAPTIV_019912 [Xenoophorus captivus]|uniref:Uncharacterized protein n=1 Tax=Xenoophorus captivus TaxID=1517983 RepID=A0ABV0Q3U3_9TELE